MFKAPAMLSQASETLRRVPGAYAQVCGKTLGFPALLVATAFAVSTAFAGKDFAHGLNYARYFLYGNLWATGIGLLFQRPVVDVHTRLRVWAVLKEHFTPTSHAFLHGLRVAMAGALSVGLVQVWSLDHGYWMILTVFLILQPHVVSTLKTSLERVGGTVLGGLIAAALGHVIHDPLWLAALVLPISIGTLAGRTLSYVAYMLFLTPHFILVAQLAQPGDSEVGLTLLRLFNSVGGALLAVGISLLVCPRWRPLAPKTQAGPGL